MRRNMYIMVATVLGLAWLSAGQAAQEDKSKRPSPPAKAQCELAGGKTITVDYSSPRAKGRKIYGGLVPYDKVWRTGANEATTFVTNTDATVGGSGVPPGSYTLFTIPKEDKWTLIISKTTGEWGLNYSGTENDVARVDMSVSQLPTPVENFTIAFDKKGQGCTMRMDWETTRAAVDITPARRK